MTLLERRVSSVFWLCAEALLLATACESSVGDDLEGRPCDAQGNCVTGYFCDTHQICVSETPAQGSAGEGSADDAPKPADEAPKPATQDCAGGQTVCAGVCVDLAADPKNCGACAKACKASPHGVPICKSVCSVACDAGFQLCGGSCVAVDTDVANCGKCGAKCAAGERCVAGVCGIVCPSGRSLCGAECVDTSHDKKHCGSCETVCEKGDCSAGVCDGDKSGSD